ncbi:MAG: LamG-like jellyroll fold domain-containing protein [bacterium]
MRVGQFAAPQYGVYGRWNLTNTSDTSGNGLTLANYNTVGFSLAIIDNGAGPFNPGKALYNTGIDISLGDATGFAIHCFFKVNSLPETTGNQRVFDIRSTTGQSRQCICSLAYDGVNLNHYISCMGSRFNWPTSKPMVTGKWYSLWFSYVSPESKIYIDGVLGETIGNYTTTTTSNRLILGANAYSSPSEYLYGMIDEFTFFNIAKSDSYIRKWESYIHGREF